MAATAAVSSNDLDSGTKETEASVSIDVLANTDGCYRLTNDLCMDYRVFEGYRLLSVYGFTEDGNGEFYWPRMQLGGWAVLVGHGDAISEALEEKREATFSLKDSRKVRVAAYRGVWRVEVWYVRKNCRKKIDQHIVERMRRRSRLAVVRGVALLGRGARREQPTPELECQLLLVLSPTEWRELVRVLPSILALHQ
jgi:hypothetical protein